MMYAKPLRDAGDRFRREHLGSDDVTDNTGLRDWTTVKVMDRTRQRSGHAYHCHSNDLTWIYLHTKNFQDNRYKILINDSELLVNVYKNPSIRLLIIFFERKILEENKNNKWSIWKHPA